MSTWAELSQDLTAALALTDAPIAITFLSAPPEGVPGYDQPMAEPTPDGRTGRVPAGCAFWGKAQDRSFVTEAADHGNCSVGSFTHGLKSAEEVAGNGDVAALVESGWAPSTLLDALPHVAGKPSHVAYGPLADTPVDPDVVMVTINAKQLMVLSDAVPGLKIEGKPQCHIIPMAKEAGEVAASVGCMLSRVRTGMPSTAMTCAIPSRRLAEVVAAVQSTAATDATVARYAGEDARRFA